MKRDTGIGLVVAGSLAFLLWLVSAASRGGSGFAGKTLWDWLELLIVPLALALAGTIFAAYFTRHVDRTQRRTDLTIQLANGYLERFDEFQDVAKLLARPGGTLNPSEHHRVRKMGNWLEMAATLLSHQEVDEGLMRDLGLVQAICIFYGWVTALPSMSRDVGYWKEMAVWCAGEPMNAGKEMNARE